MRWLIAPVLLAATCACAASLEPGFVGPSCDATRARSLVGRPASSEVAAQARQLSGARVVRWLQPGQIITMEYSAQRLNLVLDGQNRIEAIRCG